MDFIEIQWVSLKFHGLHGKHLRGIWEASREQFGRHLESIWVHLGKDDPWKLSSQHDFRQNKPI